MAPPSTSHKRALSSAEEPSPKKPASSKHPAYLTRVGETDVANSFTTDLDALWRQIPIAKPLKHLEVYCLDKDCEKHGRTTSNPATAESNLHNRSRIQHTYPVHEAAAPEALPERTAKQSLRTVAEKAMPRQSRKIDCRGDGCGLSSCRSCWPQTAEDKAWFEAAGVPTSLD